MTEPTPLSAEELAELKAGFGLAAALMPEYIGAAKRINVAKSDWMSGWWVGYGKDDSCQIEGTPNHWRWLAHLLLGLAANRDAPYSEDKPLDEPIARLFATISALTTENATLKAALESIVSIGRLENYADLLASGERITFSPELRETAAQVLAGKEAQSD